MKTRAAIVITALAVVVGMFSAPAAQAEVADGWDYRALSLGGTYAPIVGQFGGDGAADILWYAPGTGADSLWLGKTGGRGASSFTKVQLTINKSYIPIVGDFFGDDYDDIIWYAPGTAPDAAWEAVDTSSYFQNRPLTINGTFKPTVLHDYTSLNRKDDILWYAPGAAKDYLWHMNEAGTGTYTTVNLSISGTFQMVVGDWNADSLEDLVLYASGTAKDYRWASKADGTFATSSITANGTTRPVAIHQTAGDGILWWGDGAAKESYWVRNGSTFKSVSIPTVGVRGSVVSAGLQGALITVPDDLDGIFIGTQTSGEFYLVSSAAHDKTTTQRPFVADFDNDDYIDVIWFGNGTIKDELWYSDTTASKTRSLTGGAHRERATPFAER